MTFGRTLEAAPEIEIPARPAPGGTHADSLSLSIIPTLHRDLIRLERLARSYRLSPA